MNYINIYGLVFILVIMIPNIVFAIKNKDGFCNVWRNRVAETFEKEQCFQGVGIICYSVTAFSCKRSFEPLLAALHCSGCVCAKSYCCEL